MACSIKMGRPCSLTTMLACPSDKAFPFPYAAGEQPKQGRYIIGINSSHPETRKRFTIAHEMGHLVLHQLDQVHVDKQFLVKLRDDISSQAIDPHEIEANAFAAALLMPE